MKPFSQLHPWNKLIKDQPPASNKVDEKHKDHGKSNDSNVVKNKDDRDSTPKMTKGPRSQTVRMLNEARLELEDCIKELDDRDRNRDKETNVDKEKKLEVGVSPPPRDTRSNNEDTFYADALFE